MNTKQAAKFDGIDDLRTNVKFLELIKKYECLWKHDSPNYRKKSVKHKAWKEIAKVCKNSAISFIECSPLPQATYIPGLGLIYLPTVLDTGDAYILQPPATVSYVTIA
ncbi:uncharacterized protein LOC129914452 isoform X2 [Episyrphus balteatus]|uniref:uncharacterized protein LOC129914452 isoform X2 n=1 Tax=Episyrphus balteatus TaxID=286459 RepID=UPI002485E913|nr:uncharacterized protein LOC129914452 isoform X2 [Episyrphus balteatus]